MIRPGPLSPQDANYLNDQLREFDVLKRRVESMLGQAPELIPAAITSATTVSWTTQTTNSTGTTTTTRLAVNHGWFEEGHSAEGTRVTLIGGRTGTNLVDVARMPDGSALGATPTSPVHVWLRKTGLAASVGMVHEIIGVAGDSGGLLRFSLATTINTTTTSATSCTVDSLFWGNNPGSFVTLHNLPASVNFMFSGVSGKKGVAAYDRNATKWYIIQLEC